MIRAAVICLALAGCAASSGLSPTTEQAMADNPCLTPQMAVAREKSLGDLGSAQAKEAVRIAGFAALRLTSDETRATRGDVREGAVIDAAELGLGILDSGVKHEALAGIGLSLAAAKVSYDAAIRSRLRQDYGRMVFYLACLAHLSEVVEQHALSLDETKALERLYAANDLFLAQAEAALNDYQRES